MEVSSQRVIELMGQRISTMATELAMLQARNEFLEAQLAALRNSGPREVARKE